MGWKVVATLRYHRSHPVPGKRSKIFHSASHATYATRAEAERQATGSAMMDRQLGRKGVVYSVREVRGNNTLRKRRGPPKGKVPPQLRRYLFKKGRR